MKTIPLSEFPGTPQLVIHAIEGSGQIEYGFPVEASPALWAEKIKVESKINRPRDEVADSMLWNGKRDSIPKAAMDNIDALRKPDTLAVVTGQQVGLAGGPMLTLYKALTTIALAKKMQSETGIRTVPVFWMATSDHNLPETAQIHWINLENRLAGYRAQGQQNKVPVGTLKLGGIAEEMMKGLRSDLPDSEFKNSLLDLLEESYRPDTSFAEAFKRLGYKILGPLGMVLFDPEDPGVKAASRPFWERAADDVDERLKTLAARSRALRDSGYQLQVPVESGRPAIFLLEDGQRRKVVLEGKARRASSDIILPRDELLRVAREEPERLSAGVTTRPHLQGYLLPTAAYIAGPHEMAYWTQLAGSFERFGLTAPAVISRAGFTLVENKVQKRLDKLGMEAEQFLHDPREITHRLLQAHQDDRAETLFREIEESVRSTELSLLKLTEMSDYTGLQSAVDNAYRKIGYQLDKLRGQFAEKLRRQNSDLINHLERLATHLRPADRPQERVLTPFYYFARYGLSLRDGLLEKCIDVTGKHAFVAIEELVP